MLDHLRSGVTKVLGPLARLLLRIGVTPDMVTITGTLGVVVAALWLAAAHPVWFAVALVVALAVSALLLVVLFKFLRAVLRRLFPAQVKVA